MINAIRAAILAAFILFIHCEFRYYIHFINHFIQQVSLNPVVAYHEHEKGHLQNIFLIDTFRTACFNFIFDINWLSPQNQIPELSLIININ